MKAFAADYDTKWPKAVAKITDDLDVLLIKAPAPRAHTAAAPRPAAVRS